MTFDTLTCEIFQSDPYALCELNDRFSDLLFDSYKQRPGPMTRSAFRERLDIMAHWFCVFLRDMKWSRQRAYDHLLGALIASLDRDKYQPPREGRNSWGAIGPSDRLVWDTSVQGDDDDGF